MTARKKKNNSPVIAFISLGCAKNTVDTEKNLNNLWQLGFTPAADPEKADALIINSCGFLDSALNEAKEVLSDIHKLKQQGRLKYIMIMGCAVSRKKEDAEVFFSEADGFYPLGAEKELLHDLAELFNLPKRNVHTNRSLCITLPHMAYIKISEGCSRFCSFCAIPGIRGPYKSRAKEDIVSEAEKLAKRGVKELILIAQDTTAYGYDRYHKPALSDLLKELLALKKFPLIRIMYAFPEFFTDELIDLWLNEPAIADYLDLPIQHSHPDILKLMNRKNTYDEFDSIFSKVRTAKPEFSLRTTIITGFPGETEEHFSHLKNYIEKIRFTRLGAFTYSHEQGTPAARFTKFDADLAVSRRDEIMTIQQNIHFNHNKSLIGKKEKIIIDGLTENNLYLARSFRDAPEIDSVVFLESNKNHFPGDMILAKYTAVDNYDLIAERA